MKNFRHGLIRTYYSKIDIVYRLVDAILVVGGLLFSAWLHDYPWNPHFSFLTIISVCLFYLFAKQNNLYLSWRTASIWTETKKVIKSWIFVILITLALALFMNLTGSYFRRVIMTWFVIGLLALTLWRVSLHVILRQLRKRGRNKKFLAVAGAGELGVRVVSSILNNPWTGLDIIGVYDDFKPKGSALHSGIDISLSGDLDELVKTAQSGRLDYVYIALPLKAEKRIIDLVHQLCETRASVYIVPDLLMHDFLKAKIIEIGANPVVNIIENPLHGKINWIKRFPHYIKRSVDLTFSLIAILVFSPILLIIAVLILILEGPPVFYRSLRYVSVNKKVYTLKFRSMFRNATAPEYRLKEKFMRDGYLDIPLDCDVYTPIGRLLEKTQLVELPQLFNVVFDNMSLIGNRPLPLDNLGILKKIQGWERRFDSPAGMTGISQVIGKWNLSPKERLELEILYSEVYKKGNILKCDVVILYYTIKLIFGKTETSLKEATLLLEKCLE